ncbi:MAG: Omp28 family outer membrane lipoprotein [Bacteroides sp.]|nr:Omp28 family outer membrane lipoprotein [Roseburia sp.]MCM1346288.1 Omp28 family outer membrane lipoprotein [Bacteroides sp.]MCM1420857.1 Omp28 family outer membrane lipoprotein [Bacteroides sp.]
MKIGKISYILYSLAVASAFTACDSIDENERYVVGETVTAERNVLIEDFTGQYCVNCPNAHEVIDQLKAGDNGNAIIAVSIHAGASAIKAPAGLKTDEGDEYGNKWNIMVYPTGVIDRVAVKKYEEWGSEVIEELKKEAKLGIELSATLSEDGSSITINTVMQPFADIEGKLQLWITESGIVKLQQMPGGEYDGAYIHNHVFRSSVNGTWGEEVTLTAKTNESKEHTFDLSGHTGNTTPMEKLNYWNPENLSVVAFVYNDTEGVLQVVEAPVKSSAEEVE